MVMHRKTALALAFIAVIAGFALGRSTVPNIVIGVDPDEFNARGLEIEALTQQLRTRECGKKIWEHERQPGESFGDWIKRNQGDGWSVR